MNYTDWHLYAKYLCQILALDSADFFPYIFQKGLCMIVAISSLRVW